MTVMKENSRLLVSEVNSRIHSFSCFYQQRFLKPAGLRKRPISGCVNFSNCGKIEMHGECQPAAPAGNDGAQYVFRGDMEKIRAAIVGTGFAAEIHARALSELGYTVAAVVGSNLSRTSAFAEK